MKSFSVDDGNLNYKSVNGLLMTKDGKTLIAGVNGDVTIPSGVTVIGDEAFYCCTGLTSVTIPSSVASIGDSAFWCCTGLTSVTIPSSVTSIGRLAFVGCYGLGDGVIIVDNCVLTVNETRPTSVVLPEGTRLIAGSAFFGCSGLTSVTIPSSVTSIGNAAFSGCSGLTSVTIPSSVTSIGDHAFSGCSGLTSVTIPSSVTSIGQSAFYGCIGLTSVTIPSSVTSIGNCAFQSCSGLTSVTIPSSVTSIGEEAFSGTLFYDNLPDGMVILGSVLYAFRGECHGKVVIPTGVTSIGSSAFSGCSGLTSITIPSSVTSIGDYAFSSCINLGGSIDISLSVTNIGYAAFCCNKLKAINVDPNNSNYSSVDGVLFNKEKTLLIMYPGAKKGSYAIPDGVKSIDGYAFSNCSGITKVTIPKSVTEFYPSNDDTVLYFLYCANLKEISVADGNTAFCSQDGVLFNKDKTCLLAYPGGKRVSAYTIPSSVTSIGDYAFYGCEGLTNVTIPSSVTSIGSCFITGGMSGGGFDEIFYEQYNPFVCPALQVIDVAEKNAKYLSSDGVLFNKDKTELIAYPTGRSGSYVIPSGVTNIVEFAFSGCSGLKSVMIPSSVMSIGYNTFNGCYGLRTVYVCRGDVERVKNLIYDSVLGGDVSDILKLQFVIVDNESSSGDEDEKDVPSAGGFTGEKAAAFNGLVYDADGVVCGIVQVTTGKATKKGVKVGGFVMLADGKKQTIKSSTVAIENGYVKVSTKVGKLGTAAITVGGDGFKGTLGNMTLASAETDENTGILSGTLKMSYFDAKSGKIKTKSIKIGGVTADGKAAGSATIKGQATKSFSAEVE